MSGALIDTMAEGRIQKALSGFYYVDTGAEVLTCRARGKFRKEGLSPLVGDRVTVTYTGELSVVDAFTGQVLSVEAAETE